MTGIADLTRAQQRQPSPRHVELVRVSRIIAAVAVGIGAACFALAVLVGMPPSHGFLFAVGVTVALVPEGLLLTVTLSLAIGAQRMARHHALAAFLAVFVAAGWRPGEAFPGRDVQLAAAGAAFTAVVLGQAANAFACRSTAWPPWRLGWAGNRLLIGAVAAEVVMLAGFPDVTPIAGLLDHGPPPTAGLAVALLAIPGVLAADALQKAVVRSSRDRRRDLRPYAGARPRSQDREVSFHSTEEEPWRVRHALSSERPGRAR